MEPPRCGRLIERAKVAETTPVHRMESRKRATVNHAENDVVGCRMDRAVTTVRSRHTLIAGGARRGKPRQVIGSLHRDGRTRPQPTANRLIYTFECVYSHMDRNIGASLDCTWQEESHCTVILGNVRQKYGRDTRDCLALCCVSRLFSRRVDNVSSFSSLAPVFGGGLAPG